MNATPTTDIRAAHGVRGLPKETDRFMGFILREAFGKILQFHPEGGASRCCVPRQSWERAANCVVERVFNLSASSTQSIGFASGCLASSNSSFTFLRPAAHRPRN